MSSRKMLPSSSTPDTVDCPIGKIHSFGNSRWSKSFFSKHNNFFGSTFTNGSVWMLFTPAEIKSTLRDTVSKIVSIITEEQVLWINTGTIITFMQNQKTVGYFPTVNSPRNSVCKITFFRFGKDYYVFMGMLAS